MTTSAIKDAVTRDAVELGRHHRAKGYRMGLLVARNVFAGRADSKKNKPEIIAGKIGVALFAKLAGVTAQTITNYLNAHWSVCATALDHAAAF